MEQQEPTFFQNFEFDSNLVIFEDLLFIRTLFEFNKVSVKDRSLEFREHIDKIIPEFTEYQTIFDFFSELEPNLDSGSNFENRLILSEWLKFSLQLNFLDETIRNDLVNLIINFIGEIKHSFNDYKYHLMKRRMILGSEF